jgi:hypothetical protein
MIDHLETHCFIISLTAASVHGTIHPAHPALVETNQQHN